jgi:hypothetical protein
MLTIDNIEYVPASAIVAEVRNLRKANAPKSVIEVLLGILMDRKERLETLMRLTESSLQKCFQVQFMYSLIDNYKFYKKELEAINEICNPDTKNVTN